MHIIYSCPMHAQLKFVNQSQNRFTKIGNTNSNNNKKSPFWPLRHLLMLLALLLPLPQHSNWQFKCCSHNFLYTSFASYEMRRTQKLLLLGLFLWQFCIQLASKNCAEQGDRPGEKETSKREGEPARKGERGRDRASCGNSDSGR